MDAGTGRQDSGGLCVRVAERERGQPSAETVGEGCGHQQAIFLPHEPPHLRHDDAYPRGRPLHDLEAARPCRREDDPGVC